MMRVERPNDEYGASALPSAEDTLLWDIALLGQSSVPELLSRMFRPDIPGNPRLCYDVRRQRHPQVYGEPNVRVLKYPMSSGGTSTPLGRVVLVAQQHNQDLPTLWIEHTDVEEVIGRQDFILVGTGHNIPDPARSTHVGSCVCNQFVWHVYRAR
jgi:hypothetical protein